MSNQTQEASHRILSVAEEQLSRIILDIHDGPVQYLFTALSLLTGMQSRIGQEEPDSELIPQLAQLGMLLESSLYEIKFFMGTFRPPEFQRRPLVSIIEGLVIQHEEWTGNIVHFTANAVPDEVGLPTKIALYRILQEALSNAYRHAGVEEHWVHLSGEVGADDQVWLVLSVVDKGRGFDPPPLDGPITTQNGGQIGLRGMSDRVALLAGEFDLRSQPGHGTQLTIKVPSHV
jgi:signal transduction histidine kinase